MKRVFVSAFMTLTLASASAIYARQTPDAPQQQGAPRVEVQGRRMRQMRGGKMRGAMRRRAMHAFGQLNLTDTQKQQMRSIHESARQSTQAKREELRQIFMTRRQGGQLTPEQETRAKQLRDELREARQRVHNDALGVLTTEQRAQVDKMRQERKAQRDEWRQKREEWRGKRDQMREGREQKPPQQ